MRSRVSLLALFVCLGVGIPVTTDANSSYLMTPLPEEKLTKSIFLTEKCALVEIVEWRGGNEAERKEEVAELDRICQQVVEKFPVFIKEKTDFKLSEDRGFSQSISVIPVNSEFRNLNDVEFRFSTRSGIEYDENGEVEPIWGYHQRATSFIYIYNLVRTKGKLNLQFRTVFAHELFHALSFKLGIFHQHTGDKNQKEEEMAQQFTEWMGWGR